MRWTRPRLVFSVIFLSVVTQVSAQGTSQQDQTMTLRQLRQLRTDTESNPGLADNLRTQTLELYDVAISSLEMAEDNRAAAAAFERDRMELDRTVASLRTKLDRPEIPPQSPLTANSTVAQAEDALARERARLTANRAALRNQERVAEDRAKNRNEISQRLGELDLEIELLNDELRRQMESSARTEFKTAARQSLLARREAGLSETELLRARLSLLSDRSSLVPLETDLVQRRVAFSEELVEMLEISAHDLRVEEAREALSNLEMLSRELAEELPSLTALSAETETLANTLWASDGVVDRAEQTVKALDTTRHHQAQLNRIAELTSRKFEAYGHRGSVTRWWPDVPDDFPEPGMIAENIQGLDEEIPEVEHQLITYEQQRAKALDLSREIMLELHNEFGDDLDPALAQRVRDLLGERQDLLDELIQRLGRYSNLLVEYRTASKKLLNQVRDVERFLYSHVLWSRSVPKPIIPRPGDIAEAALALTPIQHLKDASLTNVHFRGRGIFVAILLAVIILLRQPIRQRMRTLASRVADPEQDSLGLTIRAFGLTLVLAAPLPMAFYCAGALAELVGASTYWYAGAEALFELTMVAALFELVRQIFAPYGLAEAHFTWPTYATRPLYRGLLLTEAIGIPLLYVALQFAFAGMRLDSPDHLQLYNNSLGRMAFIAAMLVFGLSILAMIRPEKKDTPTDQDIRVPWPRRFSGYVFPTVFLSAYPIIILATFVPAVLAAFGFYVTGLLLAYQMVRTLLLVLAVMVGGSLVRRTRIINRKRSLLENPDIAHDKQKQREIESAEKQTGQLFRFAVIFFFIAGLLAIWYDALPMLQLLKRVQLLPRVEMLAPEEDAAAALGAMVEVAEAPAESTAGDAGAAPSGASVQGLPTVSSTDGARPGEKSPLTLWNLLESILAGLITLVLVKNLPGVIEILLRRRTAFDSGARFAFSTLVRYSITIIGTIVVFALLGVTWDKVQWLVAALTFGLGFGLQEIVANFVSGLILLVERPVRVGDVVTIGTLMGKVSRIQIRATTISLWDRSEMIVPNKEFITTKLVNWTLSDSKRRIEIPVRIAYGTDLELVKKILVDAATQHPSVLEDPAPNTLLLAFGDDAIKMELRFVVDFGQGLATKDQVQMVIQSEFSRQGIEFALPTSEVRLVTGPDEDRESGPGTEL